jgi:ATP-dependent 26S proteasome regulatory subunit
MVPKGVVFHGPPGGDDSFLAYLFDQDTGVHVSIINNPND